ncbi:hypothetical protein E1B28_004121 [Marasmius oreades]|uniref:Uncharacterized protein n=1 Tax=Marasmius oreades TaxID=181124 RepID=A0A9P7UXZ0_9AGAR|nr:uncharacterized protein E1B28_004121 [Marasmius oreades]KAG7096707.1 hypothetical protein E1B28_004121 [Marasmius oreades]
MTERSISRGREAYRSTGRGGAGNIHPASQDDNRPIGGPDDFSPTRGRELTVHHDTLYSTGRGGAGNIRSPSREPQATPDSREQEVIKGEAEKNIAHSTGRGGLGNMSRSRSRGPSQTSSSAPLHVHSTGRGGTGNIFEGDAPSIETVMEDEDLDFQFKPATIHSTGRGGLANISHSPPPGVESYRASVNNQTGFESTGRGGAGNMRERSASREPRSQSRGRVAEILQRVVHPLEKSSRERTGDNPSVQRGRAIETSK